jgi:hypothetical protein
VTTALPKSDRKHATSYRLSPYTLELISNASTICRVSRTEVIEIAVREWASKLKTSKKPIKKLSEAL